MQCYLAIVAVLTAATLVVGLTFAATAAHSASAYIMKKPGKDDGKDKARDNGSVSVQQQLMNYTHIIIVNLVEQPLNELPDKVYERVTSYISITAKYISLSNILICGGVEPHSFAINNFARPRFDRAHLLNTTILVNNTITRTTVYAIVVISFILEVVKIHLVLIFSIEN